MTISNPLDDLLVLMLIVFAAWAIIGAKEAKWKFLNLLIVIAFIGGGLGLGALCGWWSGNMPLCAHLSPLFSVLIGSVGAGACVTQNGKRSRRLMTIPTGSEPVKPDDPGNP